MQIKNMIRFLVTGFFLLFLAGCASTPEPMEADPDTAATAHPQQQRTISYGQLPKKTPVPTVTAKAEPAISSIEQTPIPITDLWQRIRNGYQLPHDDLDPVSQRQLEWFASHQDYLDRVTERARPYLHYIVDQLEERDMPLELALLPIVESAYQPFAYSKHAAAGLWQFIPATGRHYGLDQNWWYDGRRDVIASTDAALTYLQKLNRDFDGDWLLAIAAYNCGEGTVGRAIKRNKKAGKPTDFWSLKLPKETSVYVPKLLAISHLVGQPEQYSITLRPIDNSPFLTTVDVHSQIDLALAAKLADISPDELYLLNPGFNQWATAPNGPHILVVPLDKAVAFQQQVDALPADERIQWVRHKIQSGETLGGIAKHYHTTVATLQQSNGLKNSQIRAGHHLLIPVASGKASDYPLSTSQRLATRQNAPQRGNKQVYTVKKGDTWWDIAKANEVSVSKLTHWNNKSSRDTLAIGQKLVIWTDNSKQTSGSQQVRTVNYKIRSGDSLWKISKKYNVSVAQVREWNSLSDRTPIRPGQNLTIHVDVTQQYGKL
ncbi:MAG: lytic transglycosylase [Gammaproteobacteria bacterium]|nr:MAG: lytic transglycosylase [Gammaproteobacteria bacterium]